MESITLKRVGYRIKGISKCVMWGGGIGYITMNAFDVKVHTGEEPKYDMDEIARSINDGGFGVQSIEGAVIDIYELFEYGFTMHVCQETTGDITDSDFDAITDIMEC